MWGMFAAAQRYRTTSAPAVAVPEQLRAV